MNRRRFLACLGATAATTTAGCGSGPNDGTEPTDERTPPQTDGPRTQSTTSRPSTPTAERTATRRATTDGETPAETTESSPTKTTVQSDAETVTMTFETGDDILSSPTVSDGTVYVGSNDTTLYAVDAETGDERWAFETDGQVYSSPQVVDGTVYVGSEDGTLYGVSTDREHSSTGTRVRLRALSHHTGSLEHRRERAPSHRPTRQLRPGRS